MSITPVWDAAAVENAVAQVATRRPVYAAILGFYGPVFVAQANAADQTCPAAIQVDTSAVEMRSAEGFSLIEPAAFSIDKPAAEKLLVQVCRVASQSGEKLSAAGNALAKAMTEGVAVNAFFDDILDESGRIGDFAHTMGVPPDMLSLLFYLAAKPSVEAGSRQLASRLTASQENRSSCPVCGSAPILGELDAEGKQWNHCGFCWHRWPVKRLACPFCSNRDNTSLEYVYSDDEPEYRVNLCHECRRYMKVVDTRKLDRGFYPPLEQVASLHLDLIAAEKGYSHGVASTPS
ncbi:formate dehydrogenase accessory protein FdhE [Desulfosarcina alkanivorans]|uniref:Formate dehydrogenase accessory protein FdhE n=1 Tax=Desulfosarcina alkanivorans TaxID=571177 RepID=A0A5K7YNB0_9BACT|nr:formate dehydrogenase accessory protein FdhE [Desulfosarcina alkanivorans]BBO69865.1 formate dehydrogenase accessory protein FdhE [Desulfosarcina alkanivorans]